MELKKYKLGEILDVKRGASLAGEYYATQGEYIRLTCGNFDYNNNCFKDNTSKDNLFYIGPIKPEFIMQKGDIITPLTEQAIGLLGSTALIPESGKYIQSQDVAKIICKEDKLYPKFAFYLISSKLIRTQLSAAAQQTKIRHTSPDKIKDCVAWIPRLEEQKTIGDLLSKIDSKIALNRRINTRLEQIAKRLYNYWFVQFDFPNADGKPYKSSGGKMVWNEQLKREIPEGWEVKSVSELTTSARGVSYTAKDEKSASDENVVLILRGNNISENHIVYDGNTVYVDSSFVAEDQKIKKYDVVITMSSGSKEHVGKSAMFFYDSEHSYGAFCNKLTPKKDCQFFIENYLHSDLFIKFIRQSCSGTGINNLTNAHFAKSLFAFPSDSILQSFNNKVRAIYDERGNLEQETAALTALRDRLLPLLMNGQVEVA
ncbi:MAG: restriction endonuclease subunit S [Bacteroidales bacterium]|nr:restriction endonuclease subunit S [Bacteroidales bacterium]